MKLIETITLSELKELSEKMSEPIVKAVVDVETREVVIDVGMHADAEEFLLLNGSSQSNLWGFNYWPLEFENDAFVEFDSLINIRPRQGNRSRGITDPSLQAKITEIARSKIHG